ncbi:hypothetical protein HB364_09635 [Pseudoflavitalea sp. X16]|uniref:hypothetical protein n=1 Tax=Paraflavitalea devenefica TaxID=2716334 RepID=UPI00141E3439|nr:hypothetical protein [Paraflavitalea devenefica]NII25342.1 hypothetical protein [Paraflavitalea devenefica]
MKLIVAAIVSTVFLIACKDDSRKQAVQYFQAHQKALMAQQQVNNFSLQLAYMPATVLPGDKETSLDSGYYHFRLQVQCPSGNGSLSGDKTSLYYGLDSLFVGEGSDQKIYPVSVQPVITGSHTHFEYLLVFAKKDWKPGTTLEIIFNDRLFTNTRMSFVFDRTKINEIELLHS